MDYLWLKALHLTAAITWVGGLLIVAVTTSACSALWRDYGIWHEFLMQIRRWDQRVTTPAMLLVWTLGLALAITGEWLSQPWFLLKISLALVLSALHGALSGELKRVALGQPSRGIGSIRFSAVGTVTIVFVIVILVITKPF